MVEVTHSFNVISTSWTWPLKTFRKANETMCPLMSTTFTEQASWSTKPTAQEISRSNHWTRHCTLTLVTQSMAKRKVKMAVAKVKSFRFLLRILKSSLRPVMTASMPPIWWTQAGRGTTTVVNIPSVAARMNVHLSNWANHPAELCMEKSSSMTVNGEKQPWFWLCCSVTGLASSLTVQTMVVCQ